MVGGGCKTLDVIDAVPPRQSSPTPSLRGSDGDGLTAAERRKRKALEYEEDEPAEEPIEQIQEAVKIPNLAPPRSSDGNVSPHRT